MNMETESAVLATSVFVNRISPDIQQFTNKWLRKSVYNDKYTFNIIETIVDNHKSDATHIDMRNMQN